MSAPLLQTRKLTKRFGGLSALTNVDLDVSPGEIVGLIGPNGAGKTTLFSTLVGLHKPTAGEISLEGRGIAGWKPHRVAAAGMVKTFQNVALFQESTALDNVLIGGLMRHDLAAARALAKACIAQVGAGAIGDKLARDLSFPERARVEVARALCTEPKILLLDEAMAAFTHVEMDEFLDLLRRLRDGGLTLIVVEHHMRAIMSLCERIVALNFGEVIADGTPAQVARDPEVVRAYLGSGAAGTQR